MLKLEIIQRKTPLGMKQYLLLDGALWDVEQVCLDIKSAAVEALAEKRMRDLVDLLENVSTGQTAPVPSVLLESLS